MRSVMVTIWDSEQSKYLTRVPGKFHCWGSSYKEFESGPGNYSVAIIELEDGRIKQIVPDDVQFVKETEGEK